MKTIMNTILATLLLSVSSVTIATTNSTDYYAGISYGKSKFDTDIDETTGTLDESDRGFKLFAGANIDDNFAVEAHYANLGETSINFNNGTGTAKFKAKSYGIAGVYNLTSDTITPFVKLGYHKWDVDANPNENDSDDGSDLFYGVGVNTKIAEDTNVRFEFERFKFGSTDIDYLSLGVAFNF